MLKENEIIAKLLYDQAVANEVYPDNPDGDSLQILNMLADIRKLGYDYSFFADIELRRIKDVAIMAILLDYYPRIDSVIIKEKLLRKIDPKRYPVVFDLALEQYEAQSPLDKEYFSGFQEVLSRSARTGEQISLLLSLMEVPDNYASSFMICKKLAKTVPERFKKLSFEYSRGVLLPAALNDFVIYGDTDSIEMLKIAESITEEDIKLLIENQSYKLCVTMQEHWARCCTVENIRNNAKSLLKKLKL